MRNVESTLLFKWFEDVWNKDDESAIDRLMAKESTAMGIIADTQTNGADEFKVFFHDFRSKFHDIKVKVEDVITQDDMEAARTTVSAIHTESGRMVTFSGMCMVKVGGGKILKAWNNYDFLSLNQQLGQTQAAVV